MGEKADNLFAIYRLYSKFFENENRISLIQGRDIVIINIFLTVMRHVVDKNVNDNRKIKDFETKLRKQILDFFPKKFINYLDEKYFTKEKYLVIDNSINSTEGRDRAIKYYEATFDNLVKFMNAYYLTSRVLELEIVEEPLVEFNNYMAHILQALLDKNNAKKNIERANAHLFRGTLDSCKFIIKKYQEKLKKDTLLLDNFITLRNDEIGLIGIHERNKSKIAIQIGYYNIAKECLK